MTVKQLLDAFSKRPKTEEVVLELNGEEYEIWKLRFEDDHSTGETKVVIEAE